MDRSVVFYLIADTYTQDAAGQQIATRSRRMVYGRMNSVTRAEWSAAGELGIKPEYQITMFGPDYNGEPALEMEINGQMQTFGIYRTYQTTSDDLELYVEWKVGNSNDGSNING